MATVIGEVVQRFKAGDVSEDELRDFLLNFKYADTPAAPDATSDSWWQDTLDYDQSKPGSWGEVETYTNARLIPLELMLDVRKALFDV